MICQMCCANNCDGHLEKVVKVDSTTNLEFEIRCICNKCGSKRK